MAFLMVDVTHQGVRGLQIGRAGFHSSIDGNGSA
jgi:hypothetical protein